MIVEPHPDSCMAVLDMLARGGVVVVRVDASRADVLGIPANLRIRGLPLRLGSGLQPPITDLQIDYLGIRATLYFGGSASLVILPWASIWRAQGGGRAVIWLERVPADLTESDGDYLAAQQKKPGRLQLVP